MTTCPECGSRNILETGSEVMCRECGYVLEENPIEEKPLLGEGHFASLPALAQAGTTSPKGKVVREAWLYSTKQKNVESMNKEIELVASRNKIPTAAITEAKRLFLLAMQKNIGKGRNSLEIAYACVYLACNRCGVHHTAIEICAYTSVSRNELLHMAMVLQRKLCITMKSIDSTDFIPRFATGLKLKEKTITKALELAQKAEITGLAYDMQPATLAATCIYVATKISGEHMPQRIITNHTGVIEVTLRKRSAQLLQQLHAR